MSAFIIGTFAKYLAPALAVLAALLGVRWMGKREAKADVRADQAEDTLRRPAARYLHGRGVLDGALPAVGRPAA